MQLKQIKAWESHSEPVCLLHALPWNQGGLQYVCKWLHSVQAGLQLLGEGLHPCTRQFVQLPCHWKSSSKSWRNTQFQETKNFKTVTG